MSTTVCRLPAYTLVFRVRPSVLRFELGYGEGRGGRRPIHTKRSGPENPAIFPSRTSTGTASRRVRRRQSIKNDRHANVARAYPFGGDRVRQKAAATTTIIAHRWHLTFLNFRRRLDRRNLPKFR